MKKPSSIIVRMPNWLGDLVMATPVLTDLRRQWPEAKITVMALASVAPILEKDPDIDEVLTFRKPSGLERRQQHRKLIDKLKRGKYDLGILLTHSFSSAWWFWRGNVKNRVGYANDFRSFLLNKAVPFPKEKETQHLVITYKMLLQSIGIPLSQTAPRLHITDSEKEEAKEKLRKFGISSDATVVGINPGAAYGSAKCWLPERFEEVTQKLLEHPNLYVVYFGDLAGLPLVQKICAAMPSKVVNLAGQTSLRELVALINCCDIFLTNDSGPMHIAAALGKPLVALFGSTNDIATGPYGGGVVIHKHVECSPCYLRECPIDFRCMKRIEVREVYEELQQLLNTNS